MRSFRPLLRLAAPLAAVQAGNQLMNLVDTAVVGRLGADALGAIGLANGLFFGVTCVGIGVMFGLDPMTSQAIGAGDPLRARKLAWQSVWLALLTSAVLMAVTATSPLLLGLFGIEARVRHLASVYLWIRCLGTFPLLLYMGLRSYLGALGRTRPMVLSMMLANVVNLFLDLLLVYGGHGWPAPLDRVPALGVAGAAVATVTSVFLQAGLLVLSIRYLPANGFDPAGRRFDRRDVLAAARIGVPAGLQMAAEVGVFVLVGMLAGSLGPLPLAAHQIAITLASLTFTGATGLASAGSVLVGRAVGAGDTEGARRAGLSAFELGWIYMGGCALLFLLVPGLLARVLTDQADVITATAPLLLVAAVFQLSDGTQAVGAGVLRGAGDTRASFAFNVVGHWAVGLPIAIALGFGASLGVTGLWWGLCAGLTAVAVALYFRFRRLSAQPIRPVLA